MTELNALKKVVMKSDLILTLKKGLDYNCFNFLQKFYFKFLLGELFLFRYCISYEPLIPPLQIQYLSTTTSQWWSLRPWWEQKGTSVAVECRMEVTSGHMISAEPYTDHACRI